MILSIYAYKELDGSVTIYKDDIGRDVFCKYNKYHESKPTRRNKRITLNCYTWQLHWITVRITTFDEWLENRLKGF